MNIGIVTTWFERGAAYVSRQYQKLLSINNRVFIYARGGESKAIGDPNWDSDYVYWAEKDYHTVIDLDEFEKWIDSNLIEVVFFNEQQNFQAVLFCNKKGIKCGAYVDYYTEITVPFFNHYDFIICNTLRHYSVFKDFKQCYYVPWGTDVELFKPKSAELVNEGTVTFFHSAGFDPKRKGTISVISAFLRVREIYGKTARLVVHSQRELYGYFKYRNELNEDNGIEIITKTVPAPGLFYMGDVYVYPSRIEGIGLTIAEAISSGLPIIVTASAPMNEFGNEIIKREIKVASYRGRGDGYYWPYADIDEYDLFNCMEYYVRRINELPDLKKAARAYAEESLDWKKNTDLLDEIFHDSKILQHTYDDYDAIYNNDLFAIPGEEHMRLLYKHYDSILKQFSNYAGKHVYLYPAGNMTRQLLGVLKEHGIEVSGIVDKEKTVIEGIESTDIKGIESDNNVVVITSHYYEMELRKDLLDNGYKGDVETCFLYQPKVHDAAVIRGERLEIERMDLVLTTRCSLRCEKCANLMQLYKNPNDVSVDRILKSMGKLLGVVDKISTVYVIGGEPLLYKRLKDVIHFLKRFNKISEIVIITNGSIMPADDTDELWDELSANNVLLSISDYGELSSKKNELAERCKKHRINVEIQENLVFYDTGTMEKRNRSELELNKVFKGCATKCRSLYDGKLYYCPRSAHGMDLGLIEYSDDDYVDLLKEVDDEKIKKEIAKLCTRTDPITACDYCDIRVGDYYRKTYKAAEQVRKT